MEFKPGYKILSGLPENCLAFLFKGELMLLSGIRGLYTVPELHGEEIAKMNAADIQFIGEIDGIPCIAGDLPADFPAASQALLRLFELYGKTGDAIFKAACLAYHLVYWMRNNKYCGKCSHPMYDYEPDRARHCKNCGYVAYPRISPAVIVAVVRDGRLLLAKASRFRNNFHSVLAGFIEAGESAEECLKREVMEETGISIKDIKYFGSQPWPFPDSLMLAYTAKYESGEISIDGKEILDASWYSPEEIPDVPGKMSVARKLIDWFVGKYSKGAV